MNTQDQSLDRDKALNQIRHLFDAQHLCVLSTQKGGQPYASLVAFAPSQDLDQLFFLTPIATRKYANLLASPRVALLINSASNQSEDFYTAISVTSLGKAVPLSTVEKTTWLPRFLDRHPQLDDFANSPTTAMIQVCIDSHVMVSRFQNVVEIRMAP